MEPKNVIISIDGGGIRGVIPLVFLKRIFRNTDALSSSTHINWWGTSVGAIISASLSFQMGKGMSLRDSIDTTIDFFELRSTGLMKQDANSEARPLRALLLSLFGVETLSEVENLHVIATHKASGTAKIFEQCETTIVKALLASSALPGLFRPVVIDNETYLDGYVVAKNPTKIALKNTSTLPDVVISFGTGVLRNRDACERRVVEDENWSRKFCTDNNIIYHRIDPVLINGSDEHDNVTARNIFNLKHDAVKHLENNQAVFEEIERLFN